MTIALPRRKFLQQFASSAAFLAFLSPASVYGIAHRNLSKSSDVLSFTDLEGLGPEINAQFIENDYIALHQEQELPALMIDEANRLYAESLMREMMSEKGIPWEANDRLIWTYQYYGKCEHSVQCYRLVEYSKSVQEYLYDTIHSLLDINVNWNVLSESFDYNHVNANYFNGKIGRYTYLVNRVSLMDQDGNIKDYGLVNAYPVNRAINYITSKENIPSTSLIYLIPGNTSLVSPFSELLHITTHGPSRRLSHILEKEHDREQAQELSHIVGETITESAALLLAHQYLDEHHSSERMTIIDMHARYLGDRYALMSNTVAYMMRYGVEKTLTMYTEDPLRIAYHISDSVIH